MLDNQIYWLNGHLYNITTYSPRVTRWFTVIILYNLKNILTSDKPIEHKINIETSSPEMLNLILSRINTTGLSINVNNPSDTVIILD